MWLEVRYVDRSGDLKQSESVEFRLLTPASRQRPLRQLGGDER